MSYYNIFSLAWAKWLDFDTEAKKLGRETNKSIKVNGECFLMSLQLAFERDYGQRYMLNYLKEEIFEEIKCDLKFYLLFTTGSVQDMLCSTLSYLKYRIFMHSVVDVVVLVASKALKVNLFIFSHNQSEDSVLLVPAPFRGSKVNILLKYNRAGGGRTMGSTIMNLFCVVPNLQVLLAI